MFYSVQQWHQWATVPMLKSMSENSMTRRARGQPKRLLPSEIRACAFFFFFNTFFFLIIYSLWLALLSAFCSVVKITSRSLQVSHLSFFFQQFAGKYKITLHYITLHYITSNPFYMLIHPRKTLIFYLIIQFCNLPLSIDSSPCACAWLLIFPSALTGTKSC